MINYMGDGRYPKNGIHHVKISLQWGKYRGWFTTQYEGKGLGISIFSTITKCLTERELMIPVTKFNRKYIDFTKSSLINGYGYPEYFRLYDGSQSLLIDARDGNQILDCIVGLDIFKYESLNNYVIRNSAEEPVSKDI